MNELQPLPMDASATYRIRVHGYPVQSWIESMWGNAFEMHEESEIPDQTVFVGEIMDQAALIGFINAFYNLGHAIISVEQISPEESAGFDQKK